MNARRKLAAQACLLSLMTGLTWGPGSAALAQTAGPRSANKIQHAEARTIPQDEDGVPAELGTAAKAAPSGANRAKPARPGEIEKTSGVAGAFNKFGHSPPARSPYSRFQPQNAGYGNGGGQYQNPPPAMEPQPLSIEQAAAVQGNRTAQPQYSQGSSSEIQRKLEELYRKNGREMPSMNMNDLPSQQNAPPNIPGTRHGPSSVHTNNGSPRIQPAKPGFFDRLLGRAPKGKPLPATAPVPRNSAIQRPQQQLPPMAARPTTPPTPAYHNGYQGQPPAQTTPVMPQAPPAGQALPTLSPQGAPLLQPAPANSPAAPPAKTPSIVDQGAQPYLDESPAEGNNESLDLSDDVRAPAAATQAPQVLPNRVRNARPTESPYSGLTIDPSETEQKIAGGNESTETSLDDTPLKLVEPPARNDVSIKKELTDEQNPIAKSEDEKGLGEPSLMPRAPAASTTVERPIPDDEPLGIDDEEPAMDAKPEPGLEKEAPEPAEDDAAPKKMEEKRAPAPQIEPSREPQPLSVAVAKPAKGFKGFCPVTLKDDRRLVAARDDFQSEYVGRIYSFATAKAKAAFDDDPARYLPAGGGSDVVKIASGEEGIEGTIEHAAWYRGKLYLFHNAESRSKFVGAPRKFMIED